MRDENQQLSLGDVLLESAKIAFPVALATHLIGTPRIHRFLNKATRLASNVYSSAPSKDLDDYTIDDFKSIYKDFKKEMNTPEDPLIHFSRTARRSIYNVVSNVIRLGEGEKTALEKYKLKVIADTRAFVRTLHPFRDVLTESQQNEVDRFISKARIQINRPNAVRQLVRDFHFETQLQQSVAEEAYRYMQKKFFNPQERDAYVKPLAKKISAKKIKGQAYSVEVLEKTLGTVQDNNVSFFNRLLEGARQVAFLGLSRGTARQLTFRDFVDNPGKFADITFHQGKEKISLANELWQIVVAAEQRDKASGKNDHYYYSRLMNVVLDETLYKESTESFFRPSEDTGIKRALRVAIEALTKPFNFTDEANFFSTEGERKIIGRTLDRIADTMPGKLLKFRDLEQQYTNKIPFLRIVSQYDVDPVLHRMLEEKKVQGDTFVILGDRVYGYTKKGELSKVSRIGLVSTFSGRYGFQHTQIEALMGMLKDEKSDNYLMRTLDIGQSREEFSGHPIEDFLSRFRPNKRRQQMESVQKFSLEEREAFENMLNNPEYYEEQINQYAKVYRKINSYLSDHSESFDNSVLKLLKQFVSKKDKTTVSLINVLSKSQYEMETQLAYNKNYRTEVEGQDESHFLNYGLENIMSEFRDNPDEARHKFRLRTDPAYSNIGTDMFRLIAPSYGNISDDWTEMIRKEVLKEILLRMAYDTDKHEFSNIGRLNQIIESLDIGTEEKQRVESLAQFALFENITKINRKESSIFIDWDPKSGPFNPDDISVASEEARLSSLQTLASRIREADKFVYGNNPEYNKFKEVLERTLNNEIGRLEQSNLGEDYIEVKDKFGDYFSMGQATDITDVIQPLVGSHLSDLYKMGAGLMMMHEAGTDDDYSHLQSEFMMLSGLGIFVAGAKNTRDIIKEINQNIHGAAIKKFRNRAGKFLAQFTSGYDQAQNVTAYSGWGMFLGKRLSDEFNLVGLGFSNSTYSQGVLPFYADIMFKRVIPAAVVYEYGDYLNDVVGQITGQTPIGAIASGMGSVDLAARKIIGQLGLDDWMKESKSLNPIWQYWGGKDTYQNYEERSEWYRSGYQPVRSNAWWTWGGISEARGSSISYWQPSFVRRINSDWKDESLYEGSHFWKWSHSWLPTPTNPLSPLFALADPYYMERWHSEDRPYALSGALFTEGTPWGVLLNPTIGEIIKPTEELHPHRLDNGIDVYALIRQVNEGIRQSARNYLDANYIQVKGGDISAVNFNSYLAPTPDTKIVSAGFNTGAGTGTGLIEGIFGVYGGRYGQGGILGTPGQGGGGGGTFTAANLGPAPGGFSYTQNLAAGFNAFENEAQVAKFLLEDKNILDIKEALGVATYGAGLRVTRQNDVIQDETGRLGFYRNQRSRTPTGAFFTLKQKLEMNIVTAQDHEYTGDQQAILGIMNALDPRNLIRQNNQYIKEAAQEKLDNEYAFDSSQGFLSGKKLAQLKPSQAMNLLDDSETVAELLNAGYGSDFVRDAQTSSRLILGMYGFMGQEANILPQDHSNRIQKSSDMYTFTRGFWDANLGGGIGIGGFGASVSEIARRFIPSFQRRNIISPLVNKMPDWLPDRFQTGDPFSKIPKGEMRLPGRGYESLNQLHPDLFGEYGAYDRFKILADIAPYSPEYKLWREIASKTVTDPLLKEAMNDIKARAREQGKKHDFYPYRSVGHGLEYENIIVSEILDHGRFRSGNRIFKVAGVTVSGNENETMSEVLNRYIHVGQEVTVAIDDDADVARNKDKVKTINAAVFVNGESIGPLMVENQDARVRKGDESAAATLASKSALQQVMGYGTELIAHLDVPWLSDQYLRIRSPIESYKAEQVYGTSYQSWAHPLNTFLYPAVERAIHERTALNSISSYLFFKFRKTQYGKNWRTLADYTHFLTNRASFIGAALVKIADPYNAETAMKMARRMNNIVSVAHFFSAGNSLIDEMTTGAVIGDQIGRFFKYTDEFNIKGEKIKYSTKGMKYGAIAGAVYRTVTGHLGDNDWIPDRTKKNWEMTDYWDRLTYLKYMGLYHEAARRAYIEEGVDVEAISARAEKNEEKRKGSLEKLQFIQEQLQKAYGGETTPMKEHLLKLVSNRIKELDKSNEIVEGGKWTESALVYKKAADNTMQGLKEGASWAQVITALPPNDREYFMEFVKERNQEKRNSVLATVSPFLRKALKLAWKMPLDREESNQSFFSTHYLPTVDWIGWDPDVNLRDIEAKTIENEAMNLSDFGFYESQLEKVGTVNAHAVAWDKNRRVSISRDIKKILEGQGLRNVDVDVTEKGTMGPTDVIANFGIWLGIRDTQRRVERSAQQSLSA